MSNNLQNVLLRFLQTLLILHPFRFIVILLKHKLVKTYKNYVLFDLRYTETLLHYPIYRSNPSAVLG